MILWKKKIDGKKKKKKNPTPPVRSCLSLLPNSVFLPPSDHTEHKKTGLAQHANHQAFTAQT